MTILLAALSGALLACALALLVHPLLRFLKVSEVPGALLACACGRRYRRRLLRVLRARRSAYLEDIAGLPPWPLRLVARVWDSWLAVWPGGRGGPAPWREERLPGPVTAALLGRSYPVASAKDLDAAAKAVARYRASAAPSVLLGPPARFREAVRTGYLTVDEARYLDAAAAQVSFEEVAEVIAAAEDRGTGDWRDTLPLSRREEAADKARWARLERNWKDVR